MRYKLGFCKQAPQRSRRANLAAMDVLACKRRRTANIPAAMDVEDTLVLILERIDSLISLIRAASTCRRWCRVVADAGFLRRWRSLHGPPVAGDYYNRRGRSTNATSCPSFVPSSSIDARHFSLDFVIDANIFKSWVSKWDINPSWEIHDSRGSLLLMKRIPEPFLPGPFPDLVVCEPLTRRYRIIPRPPDFNVNDYYRGTYLVDGDEDEAGGRIGMSNFRVQCMFLSCEDEVVAHTTMFTVGCGDTDSTWSEKAIDHNVLKLKDLNVTSRFLGDALGSSYYYVQQDKTLITRDGSTGKVSSSVLSLDLKNYWHGNKGAQNFSVIDGGDGEPRIVTVRNGTLEVFARVDGQWELEKKVLLSKVTRGLPSYRPSLLDKPLTITRGGVGLVVISPWDPNQQWSFSVELKTLKVAPATLGSNEMMGYPCEFPWPPLLEVCLDR